MSELIIIECDFKEGCEKRFEGFSLNADDDFKRKHLHENGWLIQDDKHYCPLHKEQILKEQALEAEKKK